MNIKRFLSSISITLIALILMTGLVVAQAPGDRSALGTGFTYQGQLKNRGTPYTGSCDFHFALYDALASGTGSEYGSTAINSVSVTDGYFTVILDFGATAFTGDALWLDISVRCPATSGTWVPLTPRQAVTAAPYALYSKAVPWSGISNVPSGFADGVDNDTTYSNGTGLLLSGTAFSADTVYLQRRVSSTCTADSSIRAIASDGTVTCETDNDTTYSNGSGLTLTTNSFAVDPTYVQRRVSSTCTAGSSIRAIAEDGTVTCETDDNTTYTAGTGMILSTNSFSVDPSYVQRRVSSSCAAGSAIKAIAENGTVTCETVGGTSGWSLTGNTGTNPTTNYLGTSDNQALEIKVNALRVFRFEPNATSPNLIGGYYNNWVKSGAYGATISGGGGGGVEGDNRVTDAYGTVGGGFNNQAGSNNQFIDDVLYPTVGGGANNIASGDNATISGGYANTANGLLSFIGGGESNTASGEHALVGGGSTNVASGNYSTIAGGWDNDATSGAATIGGGTYNLASNDFCTIGGGESNTASGLHATIGGGEYNTAIGEDATIAGGSSNSASQWAATIGGGSTNTAGYGATVGGGYLNTATGSYSIIPGGYSNTASGYNSFAAGTFANANNPGCFVWGDTSLTQLTCSTNNRWLARASGGVYFYTNAASSSGMYLAASGSAWNTVSNRDLKENFSSVDKEQLLANLAQYPISSWNYKAQDESVMHVGMMADEFNSLIAGLGGEGEDYINSMDATGVALAAAQGLYAENQELKAENASQQEQIDDLEARLSALEQGGSTAKTPAKMLNAALPWLAVVVLFVGGGWMLLRRQDGQK